MPISAGQTGQSVGPTCEFGEFGVSLGLEFALHQISHRFLGVGQDGPCFLCGCHACMIQVQYRDVKRWRSVRRRVRLGDF